MTNTEVRKSSKEIRAEWVGGFASRLSLDTPMPEVLEMAAQILREGPELARPDFARWQRRFRFLESALNRGGVPVRQLLARTLLDLSNVDRYTS